MRPLLLFAMLLTMAAVPPSSRGADDQPVLSGAGGAAGIGQYPPDAWGVAAATVTNPTEADRQLLVTFNFDDSHTLQFGVEVWIPARTRRSVWIPMRSNAFEIDEYKPRNLPLTQRLIDHRGDQPVVLDEATGVLSASRDPWITGMLTDGGEEDDDAISTALAMRRSVEYSRRMAYLNERSLPPMVAGWQGLNALVLSRHRPGLDSAQIAAMRQWLLSGGKLWVMLDHVEPDAMAALLGDAWTIEVVDRVPLSTVRLRTSQALPGGESASALSVLAIDDAGDVTLGGKAVAKLPRDEAGPAPALAAVKAAIEKRREKQDEAREFQVIVRIAGGVGGEAATSLLKAVREGGAQAIVEREHEQPVDLVRVLASDMEVIHTVGDWPASLRKPVGKGQLLVTTLGARGWMEPVLVPQTNMDGTQATNNEGKTILIRGQWAHDPLRELGHWFHTDRRAAPLPPEAFDTFLAEQIGYEIVGRGTVMLVLMMFCAALLLAGLLLLRGGRLEHLSWIGIAAALVVTVALFFIGRANQRSVPLTAAQAQFVQVAPDQQQAISSGLISLYNPGGAIADEDPPSRDTGEGDSNALLSARAGGFILPADLGSLRTRNVRMVWTDFHQWHWQNVPMPPGAIRRATFERIAPLNKPVHATVTFDAQGVVGRVQPGDLGPLSNMLIATPSGAMATRPPADAPDGAGDDDGVIRFAAAPADALSAGQYISAGVLDETQRRRQEVYRSLLAQPTPADASSVPTATLGSASRPSRARVQEYPHAPVLLGWTDPLPMGFDLVKAQKQVGAALVAIPIVIQRPPSGTAVTVPSAFLPYSVSRNRYGATRAVYSEDRRIWNPSSVPGTLPLLFRVPDALLPLRVTSAAFKLDLEAPGITVDILVDRGGRLASIAQVTNPTGPIAIDLPAADVQPDVQGEITVVFRISYARPGDRTLWRVKEASLEVKGEVGEVTK